MTKIGTAMRKAAQKRKAVVIAAAVVRIAQGPIVVKKSGELAFTRGANADPAAATVLLFDPTIHAYRAVLTPPGTSWELVEKKQGPQIWKPGMKT